MSKRKEDLYFMSFISEDRRWTSAFLDPFRNDTNVLIIFKRHSDFVMLTQTDASIKCTTQTVMRDTVNKICGVEKRDGIVLHG